MSWFSFHFNDFAVSFLSILFEGVPFLLLGSLISGLVDVFVSSERVSKMLPKNPFAAVLVSGLLGLIFPMCECGSVIVIRRFLRKGLPVSCAVTYMLGAPIVSPIVALSTFAAFKGQDPGYITLMRLVLGYAIAVAAGMAFSLFSRESVLSAAALADTGTRSRTGLTVAPTSQPDFASLAQSASFGRKLLLGLQSAVADFLDVAFFLIIGAAITSVFNTAVNQAIILPYATNEPLAILVLMLLAAGLALCSTTDAFVAASFASFPVTAKLAFMLFGPVFDVKLFWLYGLVFRRRAVVILSIALFIVIALICLGIPPSSSVPGLPR